MAPKSPNDQTVHTAVLNVTIPSIVFVLLTTSCRVSTGAAAAWNGFSSDSSPGSSSIDASTNNNTTGIGTWSNVYNSSLACTRGMDKTHHYLECEARNETEQPATSPVIVIRKLFYGATPKTSNCHRTAPYTSCCLRDPENVDCIFASVFKLDEVSFHCSGEKERCQLAGRIVMSSRGQCNVTLYPDLTSFSFVEYQCIDSTSIHNMCHDGVVTRKGHHLYLDSDHHHIDTQCGCVMTTQCGASVVVEALIVQLRQINSSVCVEEMTFQDLKDANSSETYSCHDYSWISNQVMFISQSNAVGLKLDIQAKLHWETKLFVSVRSSNQSSTVKIRCGHQMSANTIDPSSYCPGEIIPSTTVTLDIETTPREDGRATTQEQTPDSTTSPDTQTTSTAKPSSGDSEGKSGGDSDDEDDPVTVVQSGQDGLHPGAVAGMVLSVLGILLVVSQVLFYLYRRRHRHTPQQERVLGASMRSTRSVRSFDSDDHIYTIPTEAMAGRENPSYHFYHSHVPEVEPHGEFDSRKSLVVSLPDPDSPNDHYYDSEDKDGHDDYEIFGDPPPYSPE